MNRETVIRWVVAGLLIVGLMLGWKKYIEPHFFPPPEPVAPRPAAPPSAPGATPKAPGEKPGGPAPSTEPAATPAMTAPPLRTVGAAEAPAKPIVLGSATYGGAYDMEVEVTARGAAVQRLTLARHDVFRTVEDRDLEPNERAAMDLVVPDGPFPAFAVPEVRVSLKGVEGWSVADLSETIWRVDAAKTTGATAAFSADIQDADGKTLVAVLKSFTVYPREASGTPDAAGPQYEMRMHLEFAAADERVEKIAYALRGPPALPREGVGMAGSGMSAVPVAVAGAWAQGRVVVSPVAGKDLKKAEGSPADAPPSKSMAGPELAWIGEEDKYFAVIMIPQKPSPEGTFAAGGEAFQYKVTEHGEEVPQAGVRILSKELPLAKGQPVVCEFAVFAGPKDPHYFDKHYASLGFPGLIQWAMCCLPIPYLPEIARFLVTVLELFYAVVHNYGVAIILLVIVLRVAMLPVSRWSAKTAAEMQKLQPKMKQIREEFKDDPKRMQEEMAKIGGFKMMSGCLPMVIQMPIWVGLYGALGAAIQLRHAALLPSAWVPQGSLFLQDLSAPDMLFHWATPIFLPGRDIPLVGTYVIGGIQNMLAGGPGGITSFNLLPIFVAVAMYLQQKMTPQPPAADAQADQQRKMMSFMMIFFGLMLYSVPSGLCLYIVTSSFLGFFEQRYFKRKWMAAPAKAETPSEAPAKPAPPAERKSLVSGREKSLAERIQSWVENRIAPSKDKEDDAKGGRKRRK